MRKHLGLVFGSIELCVIHLTSWLPSNLARILIVRIFGGSVGAGNAVHHALQLRSARKLRIGSDNFIAENVVLDARGGLKIGDHVSVNSGVQIWTAQHDWQSPTFAYTAASVELQDRSWISARAIVLPGVTIGEGAVVAAGAVVTKNVEPWTLVGGVPAKKLADRPKVEEYLLNASRNKPWWW